MDKALLARVEKQAWFHKYPRGWPFLLFLLASIGTAVSVLAIERADAESRRIRLDLDGTEIAAALQRRAAENIALLRAGAALFSTEREVSEADFREFATGLRSSGNLHGSLGMGWAPWVSTDGLGALETELRDRHRADFLVFPRPQSGQQYAAPVVYLEPMTQANRYAVGYDMYSETVRRNAMDKAAQLGRPVPSGKVHLVQDKAKPGAAGFIIYMPVYVGHGAARRLKGFVYSPFRADEFLDSAAELYVHRGAEITIYDEQMDEDRLMAHRPAPGETGIKLTRAVDIADRRWILEVSAKRQVVLSPLSRLTLFFGAVASLMVMAIGRLITKRAVEDRQVLEWLSRQSAIRNSLTRELNHRVKNTLANVLSIAALTRRRSSDIDEFTESLTARIRALSATHDLLSESDWTNAPLGEVVRSELAPYMEGDETHVELSGPDILLAPNDAMSLGLAIHELATNAAKYGALTTSEGRIFVTWRKVTAELAEVKWREEGGPPVSDPTTRGFGRDLIEKVVAQELRSEVDLQFKPGGVECRLQVPVRVAAGEFSLRGGSDAADGLAATGTTKVPSGQRAA